MEIINDAKFKVSGEVILNKKSPYKKIEIAPSIVSSISELYFDTLKNKVFSPGFAYQKNMFSVFSYVNFYIGSENNTVDTIVMPLRNSGGCGECRAHSQKQINMAMVEIVNLGKIPIGIGQVQWGAANSKDIRRGPSHTLIKGLYDIVLTTEEFLFLTIVIRFDTNVYSLNNVSKITCSVLEITKKSFLYRRILKNNAYVKSITFKRI